MMRVLTRNVDKFRLSLFVWFVIGILWAASAVGSISAYSNGSADGYPRTVVVNGEPVVIPAKPVRIAAVSGDVADIVLELVDTGRVVVVPTYMDNPAIYRNYDKVDAIPNRIASSVDLDPEAVLAYDPDLIMLTLRQTAEIDALKLLALSGIPIIAVEDWSGFEALQENVMLIGRAIGEEEAAARIVQQIEDRLAEVERRLVDVAPRRVLPLSVFSPEGTTPWFIGPTSYKYDVLMKAGAKSAGDSLGITRLVRADVEQIVQADPEYLLLTDWTGTGTDAYRNFLEHPAMQAVTAVVEDNVLVLPYRELWTSLDTVDGVEKVAKWLYPERF